MKKKVSERSARKILKQLNERREVSPKATKKFSEIGTIILEDFANYIEDVMNEHGEKTRVMPIHIEVAHSRFMRDKNGIE